MSACSRLHIAIRVNLRSPFHSDEKRFFFCIALLFIIKIITADLYETCLMLQKYKLTWQHVLTSASASASASTLTLFALMHIFP